MHHGAHYKWVHHSTFSLFQFNSSTHSSNRAQTTLKPSMRPSAHGLAATAAALLALAPAVTAQAALLPAAAVAGLALIPAPVAANTSAAAPPPAATPAPGDKLCYFPAGNVAKGNVPCDPTAEVSPCCGDRANCLPNGLCKVPGATDPNYFARGACTDQSWQSLKCVQRCQTCKPPPPLIP